VTAPPSPDDLKRTLAVRILALAQAVVPDGKVDGAEWVGHGPDGAKWGIVIKGGKTGYYQNFGSGSGGTSGLGLIRDAVCDGDPKRAYAWALKFLGDAVLLPASMQRPKADPPPPGPPPPDPHGAPVTGLKLYLEGEKFAWDNPAGRYLQGRGIDPDRLSEPLRALRYHRAVWHADVQRHLPAMLAAVIDPVTRKHIAVHRTYLGRDPDGSWRKSRVAKPKKVLGSFAGGIIPLARGASGKPLARAPDDDQALIAEGIENALTVAQWFPEWRALAAVAVANLPRIALPPQIARVMLVRDRDGENRAVQDSRDRAVTRWTEEGRTVSLWEPPEHCKDANDYWRAVKAGTVEA
jgi:hypothetical protein